MSEITTNVPAAVPVDESVEPPPSRPRKRRLDLTALVLSMTAVVGVSLYRVVTLGFVPVAADDAGYIGVGRAIPTIVTSDAVERVDESGTFTPEGPTVIAATRSWLKRYARKHPTDGTRPYQPLRSLPR